MILAAACALMILVIIICIAWALPGRRFLARAARYHLTRRRYARRMRGPLPWWDQDIPYDKQGWDAALDAWEAPAARPERTRT